VVAAHAIDSYLDGHALGVFALIRRHNEAGIDRPRLDPADSARSMKIESHRL
jgi:hypothetical protein